MSTQSSRKWEIYTYFMKILMTFWRETLETFRVTWITVGLWEKIAFHPCIIKGFNIYMSRFFCNRLFDDMIYPSQIVSKDAVFKRYALHSIKTRTLGTCLLLDSISLTIKRVTNDIYFLCWDLSVHNTFIHKSEWLRNKVNIILFVGKTVCVMVPSVLWIWTMTCPLTTFDCNTLVTFQRKMTMPGHSDRHERLKSAVKSEGKRTHAQSIFSLHYTSDMEFLKLYC